MTYGVVDNELCTLHRVFIPVLEVIEKVPTNSDKNKATVDSALGVPMSATMQTANHAIGTPVVCLHDVGNRRSD